MGGKRSIFLTNTVVLAHQQKNCIERATALKVSVYTGDMNVDAWRKDQWYGEFENNQVKNDCENVVCDLYKCFRIFEKQKMSSLHSFLGYCGHLSNCTGCDSPWLHKNHRF